MHRGNTPVCSTFCLWVKCCLMFKSPDDDLTMNRCICGAGLGEKLEKSKLASVWFNHKHKHDSSL